MARHSLSHDAARRGRPCGDSRALARAISLVENRDPRAHALVRELYPETGRAFAIGVTGPPGVGKSSLIAALVRHVRSLGLTVGVVSVDPSSPFTQGALLGDRIRLSDHFLDPGVFIRSMGSRGHLGGLAEATLQALLLLDAAGSDVVFLETVGTGQSESRWSRIADAVLLVLMPGSGDSVQALKAGIMEIPDVIVINKMDHPGCEGDARATSVRVLALDPDVDRRPPMLLTEALRGEGVERALGRARAAPVDLAAEGSSRAPPARIWRARWSPSRPGGRGRASSRRSRATTTLGEMIAAVQRRELDPLTAVEAIVDAGLRTTGAMERPTLADIEAARERLDGISRVTPVFASSTLERLCGRAVLLKAENLQLTGAFKIRGAYNTIAQLTGDERRAGVVTASAGNHGQAVAWAARAGRHPRDDLRARRRADGQGGRGPRLRRRPSSSRARASTRRSRPRMHSRRSRGDVRRTRSTIRGSSPGRARSASSSPSSCRQAPAPS